MRNPFGLLLIALWLIISPLEAAVPLSLPSFRGYDHNHNPLVGGEVYSYQGGTSTPNNTYSDPALAIPNPNPLVLDSRGEALIYLDPHSPTKLVLLDAQSNEIRTWDNLIWWGPGPNNSLMPQQFGAKGDGLADDTAALNAAVAAAPVGGVIYLPPGTYKTTGWLIPKTVSLIADTPFLYGSGSKAATVKAAGSQDYILKFQGTFSADASTFLHPRLRNINIDGGNQTINDAGFIMEYCHLPYVEGCSFQNVKGRGVRLRTVWEMRLRDFFISNCGTVNTGSAFYIDGAKPFNYAHGCSNVNISGGIWSSNRGRWLDVSALANLDGCWIKDNKFELDSASTPNRSPTDVLHFGALSRSMIINNTFAGFGQKSGNYANLINISGDPDSAHGAGGNVIRGNRAYGYHVNGAVNGLYLGTNAPSCEEGDNTFITNDGLTCANVNVSQYPQLINRAWRNFSTSLFPLNPLPDRELTGFLSIHKVARGSFTKPFVPDANCANNAGTVLKLTTANQANADICTQLDLSRWVGHSAKNLMVRIRMRLDAAGSDTVYVNPSSPGVWNGVSATVNSTSWAWYSFACPIANLTTTNHLMDVFFWRGTIPLYVDGIEFATP